MAVVQSNLKSLVPESRSPNDTEEPRLQEDERWLLVQRIVASEGFQRAAQLRNMLLYTSRHSVLHPQEPLREHDIAQEALGRRSDFDPGVDNIVRVQTSQLRRRLAHYFETEGESEPLRVTLPKGSYLPVFVRKSTETAAVSHAIADAPLITAVTGEDASAGPVTLKKAARYTFRELVLVAACLLLALAAALSWMRPAVNSGVTATGTLVANPFLAPLVANGRGVSIIVSDTSLTVIENLLHADVQVPAYVAGFPQGLLAGVDDPGEREALEMLASKRSMNFGEASVAAQLYARLTAAGTRTELRYARDLHVRDFDEGNAILLGSRRGNPWTLIFSEGANYKYERDSATGEFSFFNTNPQPGQQTRFVPDILPKAHMESYVDVSVRPNLTHTGEVLLFNGTDMQAVESAVRFVLASSFPDALQTALQRAGSRPFEVFLRGNHSNGEANVTFDVLDVRVH